MLTDPFTLTSRPGTACDHALVSVALGCVRLLQLPGLNVSDGSPDGRDVRRRGVLRRVGPQVGRRADSVAALDHWSEPAHVDDAALDPCVPARYADVQAHEQVEVKM